MSAPLNVWSMLFYLTQVEGIQWRQDDYTALKIVNALKGRPINGYFELAIGGKKKRFDQNNVASFMPALHASIAKKLKALVSQPFDIVPIPNSTATVANKADCRTFEHARAVAAAIGANAHAVPALRWKQEKVPAHEGGSRDPQVHFENLQLVIKPTRPVVLYDDVLTTGSQMIGAFRRLAASRIVPKLGVVVGRAIKEQRTPTLGWYEEAVETESKPLTWNI